MSCVRAHYPHNELCHHHQAPLSSDIALQIPHTGKENMAGQASGPRFWVWGLSLLSGTAPDEGLPARKKSFRTVCCSIRTGGRFLRGVVYRGVGRAHGAQRCGNGRSARAVQRRQLQVVIV